MVTFHVICCRAHVNRVTSSVFAAGVSFRSGRKVYVSNAEMPNVQKCLRDGMGWVLWFLLRWTTQTCLPPRARRVFHLPLPSAQTY